VCDLLENGLLFNTVSSVGLQFYVKTDNTFFSSEPHETIARYELVYLYENDTMKHLQSLAMADHREGWVSRG